MAGKNIQIQKVGGAPMPSDSLFGDIRQMIDHARQVVAAAVNAELTRLYWNIGKRINDEILKGKRAEYGKQVVASLSQQLTLEYGKGWGERQLRYCLRTAEIFSEKKILHTLCAELSWSHLRLIMRVEDPQARQYYITETAGQRWSARQLDRSSWTMKRERAKDVPDPVLPTLL